MLGKKKPLPIELPNQIFEMTTSLSPDINVIARMAYIKSIDPLKKTYSNLSTKILKENFLVGKFEEYTNIRYRIDGESDWVATFRLDLTDDQLNEAENIINEVMEGQFKRSIESG